MLSSVTASATWSSFRLAIDEDDGRATWPRGSARFRRGMAIKANLRGTVERLTMNTLQGNGFPTSTLAGPEKDIVTARSIAEYARSLKELRLGGRIPELVLAWVGVIGRLAGRLLLCIA